MVRYLADDQDWRGYRFFSFDIYNPASPFTLALRIDDTHSTDQRNRYKSIPLESGWNYISIPFAEIEHVPARSLNMGAIRQVLFFLNGGEQNERSDILFALCSARTRDGVRTHLARSTGNATTGISREQETWWEAVLLITPRPIAWSTSHEVEGKLKRRDLTSSCRGWLVEVLEAFCVQARFQLVICWRADGGVVLLPPAGLGVFRQPYRFGGSHPARAGDAIQFQPAKHGVEILRVHFIARDRDVDFPSRWRRL